MAAMGSDPLPMFRQLHARMAAACTQMALVVLEKKHKGVKRSTPPDSMNYADWVRLRLQARCVRLPCRRPNMCENQGTCFLQQHPKLFRRQAYKSLKAAGQVWMPICCQTYPHLVPSQGIWQHSKAPLFSTYWPQYRALSAPCTPAHALLPCSPCGALACRDLHPVPLVHSSECPAQTLYSWPAGMCCTPASRAIGNSLRQAATSRRPMHLARYCCCLHSLKQALFLLPLSACSLQA